MSDRLERDIEEVLDKVEDFEWHRRRRRGPRRWLRTLRPRRPRFSLPSLPHGPLATYTQRLVPGHLMLGGFLLVLVALVFGGFDGAWRWPVVVGDRALPLGGRLGKAGSTGTAPAAAGSAGRLVARPLHHLRRSGVAEQAVPAATALAFVPLFRVRWVLGRPCGGVVLPLRHPWSRWRWGWRCCSPPAAAQRRALPLRTSQGRPRRFRRPPIPRPRRRQRVPTRSRRPSQPRRSRSPRPERSPSRRPSRRPTLRRSPKQPTLPPSETHGPSSSSARWKCCGTSPWRSARASKPPRASGRRRTTWPVSSHPSAMKWSYNASHCSSRRSGRRR